MLFGSQNSMMNATLNATFPGRETRMLRFDWGDLATPYSKPQYLARSNLDFFNPWCEAAPAVIRTPLFETIRHVYNPVLVTLARATEHTYWNDRQAEKEVYVINESPVALRNVELRWRLTSPEGKEIGAGRIPCAFAQGETRAVPVGLSWPAFPKRTVLRFDAELAAGDKALSEDRMKLTIYPRPPRFEWQGGPVLLYDKPGQTEKLLQREGVPYQKISSNNLNALPERGFLLVGCNAVDAEMIAANGLVAAFITRGGPYCAI